MATYSGGEEEFIESIIPEIRKMSSEEQFKFRVITLKTIGAILYSDQMPVCKKKSDSILSRLSILDDDHNSQTSEKSGRSEQSCCSSICRSNWLEPCHKTMNTDRIDSKKIIKCYCYQKPKTCKACSTESQTCGSSCGEDYGICLPKRPRRPCRKMLEGNYLDNLYNGVFREACSSDTNSECVANQRVSTMDRIKFIFLICLRFILPFSKIM